MNQKPVCHAWEIWRNPLFLRYCRSRLRPAATAVACLISILVSGFFFQIIRTFSDYRTKLEDIDVERSPLVALLIIQALILFVLGTAQVSGGMTAERDEGVIDYQRLLPMTPAAKVIGYLFGLPVREYVMFFCTLPFVGWSLWRGEVPVHTWLSVYGVMASTTILYHLTGLVTGTIVKNRRWAFLASIGLIFALYTVVPQAAKFGLVFLKYLTISPVIEEAMPHLIPRNLGDSIELGRQLFSNARFFGMQFSEAHFTYFSQFGLILTFFVMLCRRWKRAESHLMSKVWALGFFLWVQILLLGNAQPLISSGKLFPTNQLYLLAKMPLFREWKPQSWEAPSMILMYGLMSMILLLLLAHIITPNRGSQINGWRRARKQGRGTLPPLSDEANASGFALLMAIIGGTGWYLFTQMLLDSPWFPDAGAPQKLAIFYIMALATTTMLYQFLLESKGPRILFYSAILIVVLPLMIAAILGSASDTLQPLATWIAGLSPLTLPLWMVSHFLTNIEWPKQITQGAESVYHVWQTVHALTVILLAMLLRKTRKTLRALTAETQDAV